jgi:hypothetical protein
MSKRKMEAMTGKETIEPVDFEQCQAEKRAPHTFMSFGPDPGLRRCKNKPSVVATEKEPDCDGLIGSMSLCPECFEQIQKQMPGKATFKIIRSKNDD